MTAHVAKELLSHPNQTETTFVRSQSGSNLNLTSHDVSTSRCRGVDSSRMLEN